MMEAAAPKVETDREMKALLILAFVLVVATTALAYGHAGVAAVTAMASAAPEPSEPAALLLSGGALLAIASALRRYSV